MPLEATMLVIDNSEWMRNGDFSPNRFQAQLDAVNLLCGHKTNQNIENTVGVISYGGQSCEVLAALTGDLGKVLSALHRVKISGSPKFSDGILIAQLALKHRQNKRQEQKIIIFVGSPIEDSEADLKKLGTRLKKNKVGVDVVNFGEEAVNTTKLEAFVAAVNSSDNSHLLTVPAGPHILADILLQSPVIGGGEGVSAGGEGGMGVDPNVDPELALALRLSLEESQAQQPPPGTASSGTSASSKPTTTAPSTSTPAPSTSGGSSGGGGAHTTDVNMEDDDEQALLAQAIAMSMGQNPVSGGGSGNVADINLNEPDEEEEEEEDDDEGAGGHDMMMSEDDEMQLALQLSMQSAAEEKKLEDTKKATDSKSQGIPPKTTTEKKPSEPGTADIAEAAQNAEFMQSILSNLPGVDPNDPNIKNLLDSLKKDEKKEDDEKKDSEKK